MSQSTAAYSRKPHIRRPLTPAQVIIIGFASIVFAGSLLLMLPAASRSGTSTDFLTCLFTATSCTCVTGLVVVDTYSHWSVFGQLLILLLIQTGGLGFMTIGVMVTSFFKKNIGIRQRNLLLESMNTLQLGGIIRFMRRIVKATFIIEGIGAVLLSIRFIPQFGVITGIYYGIFHSISAFCNAGFDLFGRFGEYSSLVPYASDILVNTVIMVLIIVGGIGFVVWDDVYTHRLNFRRYTLHSKITLTATAILLAGGTLLYYLLEKDNTLAGCSVGTGILESAFSSVTARTAGFNTTDTGALTDSSKFLTIVLMMIGGCPGSTAGGIKTTTVAVMLIGSYSYLRNNSGSNVFNKRLPQESVRKAAIIITIDICLAIVSTFLLSVWQGQDFLDLMFEVASAIGTVGMSTGITRDLVTASRIVIIFLMFCGRVGSMTFAIMFMQKKNTPTLINPEEKVLLG